MNTDGKDRRPGETARRAVTYLLLTLWALMVLFHFYWMLLKWVKS